MEPGQRTYEVWFEAYGDEEEMIWDELCLQRRKAWAAIDAKLSEAVEIIASLVEFTGAHGGPYAEANRRLPRHHGEAVIYYDVTISSMSFKAIRSHGIVTRERINANRWRYSCSVCLTDSLERACSVYDNFKAKGFSVAITEARMAL